MASSEESTVSLSPDCGWDAPPVPALMTIFGASGDLARRKLLPALYGLYLAGGLHERFVILGASRTPFTEEASQRDRSQAAASAEQAMTGSDATGAITGESP